MATVSPSIKQTVYNDIGKPVMQALAFGAATYAFGWVYTGEPAGGGFYATLGVTIVLAKAFIVEDTVRTIRAGSPPPVRKIPELPPVQQYNIEVWEHHPGQQYGVKNGYPVSLDKLRRIGWHVTYLRGSISHGYLDERIGVLNRGEVKALQAALVKAGQGGRKGDGKNSAFVLTDQGRAFFSSLSREYSPRPAEWDEVKKIAGRGNVHTYMRHTQGLQ